MKLLDLVNKYDEVSYKQTRQEKILMYQGNVVGLLGKYGELEDDLTDVSKEIVTILFDKLKTDLYKLLECMDSITYEWKESSSNIVSYILYREYNSMLLTKSDINFDLEYSEHSNCIYTITYNNIHLYSNVYSNQNEDVICSMRREILKHIEVLQKITSYLQENQ